MSEWLLPVTKRDRLPDPIKLLQEIREVERLCRHSAEILEGYRMARDLGLDPRSGADGVRVQSGTVDYVSDAAVDFVDELGRRKALAARYRSTAQSIHDYVVSAKQSLGNALGACSGGIMGEQFRQVEKQSGARLAAGELAESLEAKRKREAMA